MSDIHTVSGLYEDNASQRRLLKLSFEKIKEQSGDLEGFSKLSVDEVWNYQAKREEVLKRISRIQQDIKTMTNILSDMKDTWDELEEWC